MKRTKVLKNFDKKEQVRRKEEKGITLIALVITIIVLLILAAVSIATLTGENGILTKANKAKEETETASEEEQRKLAMIEATMNTENTTFQGVTIPAGFAPTRIEGESTIDEGLVMVDSEGNSYVWIEVPKSIYDDEQYATNGATKPSASTDYDNIEKVLQNYANDYRQEGYSDTYYEGCGLKDATEYTELKNKMLKSIYENGGFWIGQYEMGTNIARKEENVTTLTKAICQEGAYPYNFVAVSKAQKLASSMNSVDCTSSLMFGIQWDLVMKYIEIKEGKSKDDLTKDSSSWGNYKNVSFYITKGKYAVDKRNFKNVEEEEKQQYMKPVVSEAKKGGILLTTGASERNSVLNIYDIAGNVWEWTLEKSNSDSIFSTMRGGDCDGDGRKGVVEGSVPAQAFSRFTRK